MVAKIADEMRRLEKLRENIRPKAIRRKRGGMGIEITWPDGLACEFSTIALREQAEEAMDRPDEPDDEDEE